MEKIRETLLRHKGALVTDFDGTLTLSGSSLHAAVNVLGPDSGLARGRDLLYHTLGKPLFEEALKGNVNSSLKKQAELWWEKQLELYVTEQVSEEILARAAALLAPRPESLELLRFCLEKEIPVWIVSAGLENVIRFWLGQQEIPDEKIRILANRIRYGEEKPAGQVPVITAWNKKERFFQQAGRSADRYLVFLGDQKEDLYWREENAESFLLREKSA